MRWKSSVCNAITLLLLCLSVSAGAQSFDSLKKNKAQSVNSALAPYLDKDDYSGLAKYLKTNPSAVNDGSTTEKRQISNTATSNVVKPLLHDAVDRALEGKVSPQMVSTILNAGADMYILFDSQAPVYNVMHYIAHHKKSECANAEKLLEIFYSRPDFDINRKSGSLPPPFAYLIRENYRALNGRYSPDYISDKVVELSLNAGAPTNTYNNDGSSLMLLAEASESSYLKNLFVDRGINLSRQADEEGNDALIAAILDEDIALVKKMVVQAGEKITTDRVRNFVGRFSGETLEYVTAECAKNSSGYDAITQFRSVFPAFKEKVQDKYEAVAKREVSSAADYKSIMTCKERFPDLENITGPKFREIASNDVEAANTIEDIKLCEQRYPDLQYVINPKKSHLYQLAVRDLDLTFNHAKGLVEDSSFYYDSKYTSIPGSFIKAFDSYYDPDGKLPLARSLSRFFSALDGYRAGYTYYISLPSPVLRQDEIKEDRNRLNNAYSSLASCSDFGLSSPSMLSEIDRRRKEASELAERSIRLYREFCAKLPGMIKVREHKQPSGDVDRGFLDSYYSYDDNGEITYILEYEGKNYYIHATYNGLFDDKSTTFEPINLVFEGYKITGYHCFDLESLDQYDVEKDLPYYEKGKMYTSTSELERDIIRMIINYYNGLLRQR